MYKDAPVKVASPHVSYSDDAIEAQYVYQTTEVAVDADGGLVATPVEEKYTFRTERTVPKVGVMIAGLGGNNGTTVAAR